MATTVQNFGVSGEKMAFSGSSEDEMNYAKAFWQSVQLLPPMESRLVSRDITQRLKTAPQGHQPINYTYPIKEADPPVLKEFLRKVKAEEDYAHRRKLDRLANFRAHDRQLLHKHRQIRKQKEKVSNHIGLKSPSPPPPETIDDPEYFREIEVDVKTATMQEIEQFEIAKGIAQTDDGNMSD